MTTILTIKNLPFTVPKEILNQVHLHKGERIIIETLDNGTIQIKPFKENAADKRLRKLLEHPYHMGKVLVKNRQDIYDDIA